MAKKLKTYRIRGTINASYPIDVDTTVQAYSVKQAKLRLAFKIADDGNVSIPPRSLMASIRKSKLTITEI